ncbi:DUF2892 domain-containing protein [Denitrificimonas sp. JX-1]|uniref:DUF2892 domain-containing protein n=1 Tax=Denitrificimonas halotolerans TaxID=3098930 RepID=A0ABU5GNA2_9GAMM|nr:DUF2892 domain-containing protein [Denitrificimonas sp. JX-1]MDY7218411.1 DUF2892 domain-containing protein [Denitrificimonas sp. JX-1]
MKNNIGSIERSLRIIVGLILVVLALFDIIGWWGWVGLIPILTGALGTCPLYSILGVSTCGGKGCPKK